MPKPKSSRMAKYHVDPTFIPRIKDIIASSDGHFDVDSIVADLTERHKEYQRKPQNVLKKGVEKALKIIMKSDEDTIMSLDNESFVEQLHDKYKESGAYEPHPGSDDDTKAQKKAPSGLNKLLTGRYLASNQATKEGQEGAPKSDEAAAIPDVVDLSIDDEAAAASTTPPATSPKPVPASKPQYTKPQFTSVNTTPQTPPHTASSIPVTPKPSTPSISSILAAPLPTSTPSTPSTPSAPSATTPNGKPATKPPTSILKNPQEKGTVLGGTAQANTQVNAQSAQGGAQPKAQGAQGGAQGAQGNAQGQRKRGSVDASGTEPQKKRKPLPGMQIENMQQQSFAIPTATYEDVGGIEHILQDIRELIEYPLMHPEIYQHIGVTPPRGVLLCGPPGSGKTLMANAIAGELQVPFMAISAPEVVSGMSGESEAKIRSLFNEAMLAAPAIIFIDEIDAITPKRENAQREMEKRIVAQLLTCMDSLENNPMGAVLVIGATNRPDALDSALRRAGRFDKEITLGVPDTKARARILRVLTRKMKLAGEFDFDELAQKTPGFVGADLNSLTKEAAVLTINRIFHTFQAKKDEEAAATTDTMDVDGAGDLARRSRASDLLRAHSAPLNKEQLSPLCVTMDDFVQAVKKVQPSAKREGFATIPNVSWGDVGALTATREELSLSILQPIKNPDRYKNMGLNPSAGVCLYGPPGCGKTLLAKAIAFECQANFISIKGPELLNKYVGESERAIRQVFQRAAASSPCVVFFDELDALAPRRSGDESNEASKRVVNQLLTEMDGLDRRNEVFVIAATNRPDMIDPAMLRPGRLDKCLYVPLPERDDRIDILRTVTKRTPIKAEVDLAKIGSDPRCEGFSGADLAALVKEAAIYALSITPVTQLFVEVGIEHFEKAFTKVFPSVSKKDARLYKMMQRALPGPLSLSAPAPAPVAVINEEPAEIVPAENGASVVPV